jgi:CopG family nickel-responsive transcriptional regulator
MAPGLRGHRESYENPVSRNTEVRVDLERISLAIEKDLLRRFDALLESRKLGNRSEVVRDLMRRRLVEEEAGGDDEVVGTLTLVYDHGQRELTDRLVEAGHHHHARVLSTLHVHLDDRLCLEVQALRGTPGELRHLADHVLALKGVKHGQLVVSSARLWRTKGRHAHDHAHGHGAPRTRRGRGRRSRSPQRKTP